MLCFQSDYLWSQNLGFKSLFPSFKHLEDPAKGMIYLLLGVCLDDARFSIHILILFKNILLLRC